MSRISFTSAQSPFFRVLKGKVDGYFKENKIQPTGNSKIYVKGILQAVSAVVLYVTLVFFTPPVWISIGLCALLGINLSLIGFNIMHEGGHQSFSSRKWVNELSAYSLNILGGSNYFWKQKHNVNHHTFTNIDGMDFDIDLRPFMRLHTNHPKYWFHRFQHIYCLVLYGFAYLSWIFYDDFNRYFTGRMGEGAEKKSLDMKEHFVFWTTKIWSLILFIGLPAFMVGLGNALIGFAIVTLVCGLSISIVFQLAHVVEDTHFPEPHEETNKIDQEWAIHQITTTANFATRSKLISWALGGLNFQVEHHLFPRISHVHYPKINQFVKETCQEFGINYIEYPTMLKAFHSHLLHVKRMGLAA
jgi:linoleoyl-CoA desaturase